MVVGASCARPSTSALDSSRPIQDIAILLYDQCSNNQAYVEYRTLVPENSNLRKHFTLFAATATTMATSIRSWQSTVSHVLRVIFHSSTSFPSRVNNVIAKSESWNKICEKFHLLKFQRDTAPKCILPTMAVISWEPKIGSIYQQDWWMESS
jgi:hypothetical protein